MEQLQHRFVSTFLQRKYSLEEILKNMTDGTLDRYDPDNYKKAWGFTFVHELVHLDPIIAEKVVDDVAYYSCDTRKIAYQNRCDGPIRWKPKGINRRPVSLNNADSFAFFGAASLFKYRLGLGKPAEAIETCDIRNASAGGTPVHETMFEGDWLAADNRTDGTYNYTIPPNPNTGNTPPDDEVVPCRVHIRHGHYRPISQDHTPTLLRSSQRAPLHRK